MHSLLANTMLHPGVGALMWSHHRPKTPLFCHLLHLGLHLPHHFLLSLELSLPLGMFCLDLCLLFFHFIMDCILYCLLKEVESFQFVRNADIILIQGVAFVSCLLPLDMLVRGTQFHPVRIEKMQKVTHHTKSRRLQGSQICFHFFCWPAAVCFVFIRFNLLHLGEIKHHPHLGVGIRSLEGEVKFEVAGHEWSVVVITPTHQFNCPRVFTEKFQTRVTKVVKSVSGKIFCLKMGLLVKFLRERNIDCETIPTGIGISEKENVVGVVASNSHDESLSHQTF